MAQHLGNVFVHSLHAKESLPVIGSVPSSFVGARLYLHVLPRIRWSPVTGHQLELYVSGINESGDFGEWSGIRPRIRRRQSGLHVVGLGTQSEYLVYV